MAFRVDGVSASYSQRRRSFNCGAVLGVCNHRDLGGVPAGGPSDFLDVEHGDNAVSLWAAFQAKNAHLIPRVT